MKSINMTLEEMKVDAKQSRSDWALLRKNQQAEIESEADEDSPDATLLMRELLNEKRAGCLALKVPNATTLAAMHEIEAGNLPKFDSIQDLFDDLEATGH